jgi:NAD+ synthase (glutamine-hydrolysing)
LQNIQARIRGKRMWDWSNATGGMWLQTGNMSEKAVGYTTIGGDMMGAYSLLGNAPKTVIIELIKHLNYTTFNSDALNRLTASTASAELAEDQADEEDLMPFSVLDACYALFVGEKMTPEEVVYVIIQMFPDYKPGQIEEWVARFVKLFRQSIFKWVQAPESVHLGSLDLDRERALQLPVVQSAEWLQTETQKESQGA